MVAVGAVVVGVGAAAVAVMVVRGKRRWGNWW